MLVQLEMLASGCLHAQQDGEPSSSHIELLEVTQPPLVGYKLDDDTAVPAACVRNQNVDAEKGTDDSEAVVALAVLVELAKYALQHSSSPVSLAY